MSTTEFSQGISTVPTDAYNLGLDLGFSDRVDYRVGDSGLTVYDQNNQGTPFSDYVVRLSQIAGVPKPPAEGAEYESLVVGFVEGVVAKGLMKQGKVNA